MPYFSFSLNHDYDKSIFNSLSTNLDFFKSKTVYFSKNTKLWKALNLKKNKHFVSSINFEKRKKIEKIGKKILFCLPPSIGLGDAVEYALSIKAIIKHNTDLKIGIAFVGRYKEIFIRYFKIKSIYEDLISLNELNDFDTIFHFSLEIDELKFQKYNRKNIEGLITDFFKVKKFRSINFEKLDKTKKITIFPISQSPIRVITPNIINKIIKRFEHSHLIEVVLDKKSIISNHIESKINSKNLKISFPENLNELLNLIENIEFGIFVDSGPLHVAKLIGKKGIFVASSINKETILDGFETIIEIKNSYSSEYCASPCGLTNIFNYNNIIGCYETNKISKEKILQLNNLNALQRGILKDSYINFINNPVGCVKNINIKKIIDTMEINIS